MEIDPHTVLMRTIYRINQKLLISLHVFTGEREIIDNGGNPALLPIMPFHTAIQWFINAVKL